MGIKKSLGYSPIGSQVNDDSSFNFIPDRRVEESRNYIMDSKKNDKEMSLAGSFAKKVKEKSRETDSRPEKKVVSYYLEVSTIKKLKKIADAREVSYSSIVDQAICQFLEGV